MRWKRIKWTELGIRRGKNLYQPWPKDGVTIERNEVWGVLGPSGVGKTTLLRMIAGLERPDEGGVEFVDDNDQGTVVQDILAQRRRVAFLFQDPVLYPHMNVRQNVEFAANARGEKGDARKTAEDWLKHFNVPKNLWTRRPTRLSGGERQRAALARAFASNSDIYLLDEPIKNSFEPNLKNEITSALEKAIAEKEGIVLIAAHDHETLSRLCNKFLVLLPGDKNGAHGRIIDNDLYATEDPQVAALLGVAVKMEGRLVDQQQGPDGQTRLRLEVGSQGAGGDPHDYIEFTIAQCRGALPQKNTVVTVFIDKRSLSLSASEGTSAGAGTWKVTYCRMGTKGFVVDVEGSNSGRRITDVAARQNYANNTMVRLTASFGEWREAQDGMYFLRSTGLV